MFLPLRHYFPPRVCVVIWGGSGGTEWWGKKYIRSNTAAQRNRIKSEIYKKGEPSM